MYRIISVAQMRNLEKKADAGGFSYAQMMQNAGVGIGALIRKKFEEQENKTILGLVGTGNNGGDTLVALTYLQKHQWETTAYLLKERNNDPLIREYLSNGGRLYLFEYDEDHRELEESIELSHFILDGILGTGIQLPLRGAAQELLGILHEIKSLPYTIAVDCPSGVDCDSGKADEHTLQANWTISMAAVKQGMLCFPAFQYVGDLSVIEIGLPEDLKAWEDGNDFCVEETAVLKKILPRSVDSHKGTFGTALLFAGSQNYPGAAYLAGKAAYLAGAGLVTIASIPEVQHSIAGVLPEATWSLLKSDQGGFDWDEELSLSDALKKASAVLIGPGWGIHSSALNLLEKIISEVQTTPQKGIVLDADGLNLLSQHPELIDKLTPRCVFTPHPGEMERLTGLSIEEIQKDRKAVAREYAHRWQGIVILKGALTVIAEPSGRVAVIPVATPALARAGSGDVLAGMLTGFLAQGMESFDAACTAAWIHGRAGVLAEESVGHAACVLAGDILNAIPRVFHDLK